MNGDFWSTPYPSPTKQDFGGTEMPAWYQDYMRDIAGMAGGAAMESYQPYQGQRIAGFAPEQEEAFKLATTRPGLEQAKGLVGQATTFQPGALNQFMDPYRQQVTDEMGRLGQRGLMENVLPNVYGTFTGGGQFGSTRSMDMANRAVRDTMADISGRQGEFLSKGYGQALGGYGSLGSRQLAGAGQLADYGAEDINMLSKVGAARQGQTQQSLDLAHKQFLEEQQRPKEQLGWLSNLLKGYSMPTQTYATQTTGTPSPSQGQETMGALTDLAGLFA